MSTSTEHPTSTEASAKASADVAAEREDQVPGRRSVLLYDGECGFCHRSIQFVEKRDKREQFFYAPLQGEYAAGVLKHCPKFEGVNTMLLVEEQGEEAPRVSDRSSAILRIFRKLGGFWRVLALGLIIPKFLRDLVYRFIAWNRQRISKAMGPCPLPSASLRARMLK